MERTTESSPSLRSRVLVVGSGFAGFHACRRLERLLPADMVDLVLVSPTDYLLYSPLLPEVATGAIEPRHIAVSLRQALPRTRSILGRVIAVDLVNRTASVLHSSERGPEVISNDGTPRGDTTSVSWDRLVLTPGSITRQFDIPGVAEHAHGFKTIKEAVYLRDHVLGQLDLADSCPETPEGMAERQQRLTVVAVGAGYTGTEFVAQMQRWLTTVAERWDRIGPADVQWILVDVTKAVLPELGARLGHAALKVLVDRGVDVRLGVTVRSATSGSVELTDGTTVPTRTLVWGAGVSASPLIATLGLPTVRGRLTVDAQLRVPGIEHVWAAGDAAAVPNLVAASRQTADSHSKAPSDAPVTPPTAQHAQRQGRTLARNVAASLGVGHARAYRHRDLGLVADLGGSAAVAKPLGMPLTGRVAKAVTRGYHLYALPGVAAKVRVAVDWVLAAALPSQVVQISDIRERDALISTAQETRVYLPTRTTGRSGPDDGP